MASGIVTSLFFMLRIALKCRPVYRLCSKVSFGIFWSPRRKKLLLPLFSLLSLAAMCVCVFAFRHAYCMLWAFEQFVTCCIWQCGVLGVFLPLDHGILSSLNHNSTLILFLLVMAFTSFYLFMYLSSDLILLAIILIWLCFLTWIRFQN